MLSRRDDAFLHFCLVLTLLAGTSSISPAQESPNAPLSRVVLRVDDSVRIDLPGNTHPLATPANDRGLASPDMPANRLLLLLQRSAQQEAELQTYLRAVEDPNSPQYRQWLTPAEFGRRFGVSDADLIAVEQWLAQQGFTVSRVTSGRIAIEFSGTVQQVDNAFRTSIHQYVVNGQQHWANASDPQIPQALAPVVAGVVALNNFAPHSMAVRGPSGIFKPESGTIQPQLTSGDTQNGYIIFMGPADAATVYDTPTSLNPANPILPYDGSGVTIGIAGDSNIDIKQNANYRATFGLPANPVSVIVDGADPGENGDAIEAYLDTQVAGGIAPGASVVLYTAADTYLEPGLFLAILRAIDSNAVDILNVSFGACELAQGVAGNQFIYDLWQQAAAEGISVTVSSGDSGSAGCDDENTVTSASDGLAVNGLASSPYNIAVGGTDFDVLYSNFPTSFTEFVDVTNSLSKHRSALSYISEEPWNDSTFPGNNGLISGNMPWTGQNYYLNNIIAGGGGASSCVTLKGTACSAGYPVPTWQSSFASPAPDATSPTCSFLAGNGLYGATWALCTDQDYINATQTQPDCVGTPTTGGNFNVTGVGGTSASAPAFAGMLALVAQKTGGRLGQADYTLYNLARSKYATVFHDINIGNNSVICDQGTPNCIAVNDVNTYFLSGFNTRTGFDEASGLGSVDAANMLSNWSGAAATATTSSLTLNGGTSTVTTTHGDPVTVKVDVSGSGGTPSGPVALVDNINPAKIPDSGAIASFPLSSGAIDQSVNSLPGGSYTVSAHYGGNQAFAASDSNGIAVTVNPEASTIDLKVRGYYDPATGKSSAMPYYGFIYLLDAQPYGSSSSLAAPDGVAIGTVSFASGSKALGKATLGSDGVAEVQTALVPGGVNALTASFPGDASFKAGTSSPVAFTVQPAASSLNMSDAANGNPYNPGQSVTITATFADSAGTSGLDSLGAAPTGTVTFISDGTTQLGTAAVTGKAGTTTSVATASATFTAKGIVAGTHNITATYSGDTNYAPSTSSSPDSISVQFAPTTLTFTPPATIKQNQPLQLTAKLSTYSGLPAPTGTVAFSASRYPDYMEEWSSSPISVTNGVATVTVPANTLAINKYQLSANYSGDSLYGSGFAIPAPDLIVTSSGTVTPTLKLTLPTKPELSPQIMLAVSGPSGDPAPTGSALISGTNGSLQLVNGAATFSPYFQNPGPNSFTVTYLGDSTYAGASISGSVTVQAQSFPEVSPVAPTVYVGSPLTLSITVSQAKPFPQATGTVTVASGNYTSKATALASGAATVTIPANTLAVGIAVQITAAYSGDTDYSPGTGYANAYVTNTPPGFTLSGTSFSLPRGHGRQHDFHPRERN